jgi:hypothetical protein
MTHDVPRHPLPDPESWDLFCDLLDRATPWLNQRRPSPDPGLSDEQFAVGLLLSAIEALLVSSHQPEPFILAAQRLSTAWQNLRNGRDDVLLMKNAGAGRPGPEQGTVWFRAEVLRLLDEVAVPDTGQRDAALEIQQALRQARAPDGCTPSAQTIRNWHGMAANPSTPAGHLLAEVRRSIEWSVPEGDTVMARVRWILGELAKWPGRRP